MIGNLLFEFLVDVVLGHMICVLTYSGSTIKKRLINSLFCYYGALFDLFDLKCNALISFPIPTH